MGYTVKQLAGLAGVSVRTLHHYDRLGLLVPGSRSAAGYRIYGEVELLRLQQILFFRELDMGLGEIGELLERPGFDPIEALGRHRQLLAARAERLLRLMETVDRTIGRLIGEGHMEDNELYEGFARDEIEGMEAEAKARWGSSPEYAESKRRVGRMGKAEWEGVKAEGEMVDRAIAAEMARGSAPESEQVAALMERKVDWLRNFYEPGPELFAGLGAMYESDDRFRKRYEGIAPGLASFMKRAMAAHASPKRWKKSP